MSHIARDEFADFFAAVHNGRKPFAWQLRLLEYVVDQQRWPDAIDAPTGSGKTAVIDIHVFCVAMMASGADVRVPRRLSIVVDRRAIVDSHVEYARQIRDLLSDSKAEASGILHRMCAALTSLSTAANSVIGSAAKPFQIAVIRGGAPVGTKWLDDPTACSIICSTPDMWGSRILLRGYGLSRNARPRAAGLLAFDNVVVIDEAHLSRQLVETARSIANLAALSPRVMSVPPLQVVSMTATQTGSGQSIVGVTAADIGQSGGGGALTAVDAALIPRLTVPKRVTTDLLPDWPANPANAASRRSIARVIALHAMRLHVENGPTVACVVNTVAMALAVRAELESLLRLSASADGGESANQNVVTLVGRMRLFELDQLRAKHPGLFTVEGDDSVDYVVATQTIEVGVDMDFSAMVTELASGSALAQRAGRVNRVGARSATEVVVVGPQGDAYVSKGAPPYSGEELSRAFDWLSRRVESVDGLAPWALRADPPPSAELGRVVLQRVELVDSWDLARTSDDGFGTYDLDIWIADEFERDLDVALVVRRALPADESSAIQLLRVTQPRDHELYSASIRSVGDFLRESDFERVFVFRNGDADVLRRSAGWARERGSFRLRPGDILVLPEHLSAFQYGVFNPEGGKAPVGDVYEAIHLSSTSLRSSPGEVDSHGRAVRIGKGMPIADVAGDLVEEFFIDLAGLSDSEDPDSFRNRILEFAGDVGVKAKATEDPSADGALRLLGAMGEKINKPSLMWALGPVLEDGTVEWIVVADSSRQFADEDIRQTWTPAKMVTLVSHSQAVQQRAIEISRRVGLSEDLVEVMGYAGQFHDEGKQDPLFQVALGNDSDCEGYEPWAKSGMRSAKRMKAAWARAGLGGWRHEQYSAAICSSDERVPSVLRDLATRLVGTSHGRGRGDFQQVASELLVGRTDVDVLHLKQARNLFDGGGWETLVERTDKDYGVWACAYLEALLRAADCQVSGEGR